MEANRDGGAGRCTAPWVRLRSTCNGSGRAGGQGRGWMPGVGDSANGSTGVSPMKKPSIWRMASRFRCNQSRVLPSLPVLLLNECLLAAGLLAHQGFDAAAEVMDDLEHVAPEGGGAKAGDDGEIAADLDEGAADRAAADLTIEILRCGHEEFGIVPAGGQRRAWPGFGPGWLVRWLLGLRVR